MSLNIIRRIMDNPPECLDNSEWSLLLVMANRAHDDGTGVWESIPNLAKRCRMSRATARRDLPGLLKSGIVVDTGEKHQGKHGGIATVVYRIDLSRFPKAQNEPQTS